MKKYLAAFGLAAALVQPAAAVTFPTLTTIHIGSAVSDNGGAANTGRATVFHCTNVSGVSATIRFLVLDFDGTVAGSVSFAANHGATIRVGTHFTATYSENFDLATGAVTEGAINIESTQSGVFCNAKTIDASAPFPDGITLPLVRVNPHPGTVE